VLARERRSDEAIADFTRAIQLHPGYVPALNERGIEYVRRREYARAIEDFNMAIKADPRFDRVQIHYNRGNAWFALGEHRRALADYRVALRQDSDYQPALVAMAACYASQGELDDAIEWQQRALEVAGDDDRNELLAVLDRYAASAADADIAVHESP
jgi:tetratricopeptide (TPR) repeat protein